MPTTGGLPPGTPLSETVGLTDNALNATGATQSVSVQGTGVQPQVAVPDVVGAYASGSDNGHHPAQAWLVRHCDHGIEQHSALRRCHQRKPGRRVR